MAANNNEYARAYGNTQVPQYQTPAYPAHPMVVIPQQRSVYDQQQLYPIPNQQMSPMQGYVPSLPMDPLVQFSGYQPAPPPQHVQYQQQYQPQYVQQPQYQQQMAHLGAQVDTKRHSSSSLPAHQFDGPASMPRPPKKTNPRAIDSSTHPEPLPANHRPVEHAAVQRQQQQPPRQVRPPSTNQRQSMDNMRHPSAASRPLPVKSNPAAPSPKPITPVIATPKPSRSSEVPVDYQVLLLALADEYISKAHSMTAMLARSMQEADVEHYHKLIASGLGCLESVLKNFKFPDPRIEARLVHRYCSLLLEETENDEIAQEMLTRTIVLCERNKLVDLRYSLIHLQLRFNFKSRPATALRMIDTQLYVIEAYKHTSWVYATRFLRASLSLQMSPPDTQNAVTQLRTISAKAAHNHHVPVLVKSSALEALVHLRSNNPEAVQLAQRALAAARMHQLNPALEKIPQLAALLDCLDLCCDLVNLTPSQAVPKMKQMQKIMDGASENKTWRSDGSLCIPVGEAADPGVDIAADTGGIFERTSDGQRALVFRWIRRSELFALGYLFSGIATAHRNGVDRKAERYLEEGAKISGKFNPSDEQGPQSLGAARAQVERRSYFHQSTILHLVLLRCNRSDWVSARQTLDPFARRLSHAVQKESEDPMELLTIYLTGLIKQGTGDLVGALAQFQCPVLTLRPNQSSPGIIQELRLLSTLNSILILRSEPSQENYIHSLLPLLEQTCLSHPDKSFAAAYNLVHVSSTPNLPIIKTKTLLSAAMSTAKAVANTHLICVTMNLMNATFFSHIVGDQAMNSAVVGQNLARRCGNPLSLAVACGMLAGTCEVCGVKDGMVAARDEGQKALALLPDVVKETFQPRR